MDARARRLLRRSLLEVLVAFAGSCFDEAGNLRGDETKDVIRDLLVALAEWVRQLHEGLGRATWRSLASGSRRARVLASRA